jgi:hypothetical protein
MNTNELPLWAKNSQREKKCGLRNRLAIDFLLG